MGNRRSGTGGVLLTTGWIERWVPQLSGDLLRTYLWLAAHDGAPDLTLSEMAAFSEAMEGMEASVESAIERLEALGLLELIPSGERLHLHFPHRGSDRRHHADPVMPSLREALASLDAMVTEILEVDAAEETEELRRKVFERHPELEEEYRLHLETADEETPPWRLWMELSIFLLSRFEKEYGVLKQDHEKLFKERMGDLLRIQIEIQDRITNRLLEEKERILPEVGEGWVVSPGEERFRELPFVREASESSGIAPRQLYLDFIEGLGAEGWVVCELDADGRLVDLMLPSTTGLTEEETHLAFSSLQELAGEGNDPEDVLPAVEEARRKYRDHLVEKGVRTLHAFARRGRVEENDELLARIAVRVNNALAALPEEPERVRLKDVIRRYEQIRDAAAGAE